MTTVQSLKKQQTRQLRVLKAGTRLSIFVLLPLVAVLYISTSSYDQRSTSHVISNTSSQTNKQRTTHTTTTDLAEALQEGKKESILQKKKEEAKYVAGKKESSHHKAEKESKKDEHHKSHKEKDYWKDMMENYNSTLELPLRPPFRVWAFGQPRTGSTFLLHLLDAIVSVKSPSDSKVFFSGFQKNSHAGRHWYENDSFVIRSHVPALHITTMKSRKLEKCLKRVKLQSLHRSKTMEKQEERGTKCQTMHCIHNILRI